MSDEVVVDALPYIDQGYDEPGVRDAVSISGNFPSFNENFSLLLFLSVLYLIRLYKWSKKKPDVLDLRKII